MEINFLVQNQADNKNEGERSLNKGAIDFLAQNGCRPGSEKFGESSGYERVQQKENKNSYDNQGCRSDSNAQLGKTCKKSISSFGRNSEYEPGYQAAFDYG